MTIIFEILLLSSIVYMFTINNTINLHQFFLGLFLSIMVFFIVLPDYYIPSFSDLLMSSNSLIIDSISFWLAFLVCTIIFSSYYLINSFNTSITYMMVLLFISCYFVFNSNDLLTLYVSYEFSLVPILFIIVNSGSYPDRSVSASYMFVYTAVFSFPLIVYVVYSLVDLGTFSFMLINSSWGASPYILSLAFIAFLVKLPVYGLHFWLPIAHVEAPTFGSIILAGLLLKMGGCGLMRVGLYSNFSSFNSVWIVYLVVSMLVSSLVCCVQSDFKRLVAYSSVAHIIVVIVALLLSINLGVESFTIIMLAHGISSPMLFIIVGLSYSLYGTRMLLLYRGLLSSFPLLSFFIVTCFVLSVPVPPSVSFLGEVQFVTSLLTFGPWFIVIALLFVFLAVLYNLLWLNSLFGSVEFTRFSSSSFLVTMSDYFVLFFFLSQSFFLLFLLL